MPASPLHLHLPAEWEPHAATWIAWPHNQTDWPGKFECIRWVYAEITRWLSWSEPVHILVNHAAHERLARRVLRQAGVPLARLSFHRWPTNRGWTRDYGPIFVRQKRALAVLNVRFNAWAKYLDWQRDNSIAELAAGHLGLPLITPLVPARRGFRQFVLEGGAIDVNGRGSMLTTEECLLSRRQQRNPGLSRRRLESVFRTYLGVENVIWLGRGIVGDDTHGHVDDIARFVAPRTVVAAVETSRRDPNCRALQHNLKILRSATDQSGRRLEVLELPMPRAIVFRGRRLPASYANFYIANRAVLVPVFNDPNDRIALDTLARLFPTRTIAPIYSGDLIWGLGAIHCLTQQQPAAGKRA